MTSSDPGRPRSETHGALVETLNVTGTVRVAVVIDPETLDEFDASAADVARNLAWDRVEQERRVRPSDVVAERIDDPAVLTGQSSSTSSSSFEAALRLVYLGTPGRPPLLQLDTWLIPPLQLSGLF